MIIYIIIRIWIRIRIVIPIRIRISANEGSTRRLIMAATLIVTTVMIVSFLDC